MAVKLIKLTQETCEKNLGRILQLLDYKRRLDGHSYDYWEEEHVLRELPRKWDASYLAIDNNEVVGFMISYLKSADELRLSKIYVLEEYRNSGVGKLLLKRFLAYAKDNNIKKATTCAADFNNGMQRLLEGLGFSRTFTWESFNKVTYYNYEKDSF
jgi:ribosomal protein S18 acetylase RimI-like enzyme